MVIQSWVFDKHFSIMKKVSLSFQGIQLMMVFVANNKMSCQAKIRILENLYLPQ